MGITYFEGDRVEVVQQKVAQSRAQYILTKPWHDSQTVVEETPQYIRFAFDLVVNKELEAQVLSFGKDMEVVEPQHFREKIQQILATASEIYR